MAEGQSYFQDAKAWFEKNKLKSVGLGWATVLGGCVAYQWTKPIPLQMKLIHSRVYAQGVTLAALAGSALIASLDEPAAVADVPETKKQ
ncbi:hypothetical protein BSKO_10404 [Bryopsis sp. KO-2023]|nr:hypothetical protein BSKO_10404 [Bryopsis sp. KO-2023]